MYRLFYIAQVFDYRQDKRDIYMTSTIKPLVIAHRGERVLAPENTIKACQLALDQGATGLEIDVRICGSGEIVLIHDPLLQRLSLIHI